MAVDWSTDVVWDIADYEQEASCSSSTDEYYLDRLFFGVESDGLSIIKYFSDEHLRYLCRIRRSFPSEWTAPEQEKQTPYQRACLLGHTEIVQHMLKVSVKVDQEFSKPGYTGINRSAFMFACHSGSLSTMRALLQALSNDYIEHFKSRNRSAICSISFAKQYLIPHNTLVEGCFASTTNLLKFVCPIHFAIARDNLEMVRLIVTGANGELEIRNEWEAFQHGGFTPLHLACLFNRSLNMIQLLLSIGEGNGNPILQTSSQGLFADQMTNDRAVIDHLRPKRLSILDARERERMKDLEEMLSGRPYQIYIKPQSGDTIPLTVTGHTTTAELAEYFKNEFGLPLVNQKFLFRGQILYVWEPDIKPLVHYGIKKDSVVNIVWNNPKCSSW